MHRVLCFFLALFLFLSSPLYVLATEVTDPTVAPAPDLSETAIPVAVEANSAIASALIGAGVQPGTNLDDFNMLVSSCVTAMESEGMFTDGKIAFVSNNVDGVQYMYAPVHLIDAVRNWLLDDSGAVTDNSGSKLLNLTWSFGSGQLSSSTYDILVCTVKDGSRYYNVIAWNTTATDYDYALFIPNSGSSRQFDAEGTYNGMRWYMGWGSYQSGVYSVPMYEIEAWSDDYRFQLLVDNFGFGFGISTSLDLFISDLSSEGYSSWLATSVDYDGFTFVPCSVMNSYDDTIILPQEYVQGGITDYTPPAPPDVTVPDWESPYVPQYPGSESAPPDNELLWGIRVAVSETIPYWIKTTAASIVEWLQRIYNHITDTVAGLVGVLSTQHDALLAKFDELKAGFGGDSSAGDGLQDEVDRQDQELDDMTDIMDSVTKPDIEEIDPDLTDEVDQEKLTEFSTPFVTMMTQGPFATMLVMSLTLVLCSYILYGKR